MSRRPASYFVWLVSFAGAAHSQTTQGLLWGTVKDGADGHGLPVWLVCTSSRGGQPLYVRANPQGRYYFPLLPPGNYTIQTKQTSPLVEQPRLPKADSNNSTGKLEQLLSGLYQDRELHGVEVPVGAVVELNIELARLSDVTETGRSLYRNFNGFLSREYGPDYAGNRSALIESTAGTRSAQDTSISNVIDSAEIAALPLTGRDIYTALLLQPGINADPSATRGLGFSANGQRPSASNFLLDGLEANNYLISGPLLTPVPEATQEYRVSTNNFSAEYGGTSGYISNAVTVTGGPRWTGTAYLFSIRNGSNANGFQENLQGYPRPGLSQIEPGLRIGGPLWRNRIFLSNSFEYLSLRTHLDPQSFLLPTSATLQSLPSNDSGSLLEKYRAIAAPDGPAGAAAAVSLRPPSALDQYLGLSRLDAQSADGRNQFLLRIAISQFDRPDYYWTPYPDFVSGFHESYISVAAGLTSTFARLVNELRVGWGSDLLAIGDNNHGLPSLATSLNPCGGGGVCLPSSTSPFPYRNLGRDWQALDNITVVHGGHILKFGGGLLVRSVDGYLRNGANGSYTFQALPITSCGTPGDCPVSLANFLDDQPYQYTTTVSRESALPAFSIPDYERDYSYRQFSFFAQGSWRVSDRIAINYGLRYEYEGAPVNVGPQKDSLIVLASGSNLLQSLLSAYFTSARTGDQALYNARPNNWGPRFGISWTPWRGLPIVARGSYGVFYDRPFDNLWQTIRNNSVVPASSELTGFIPYLMLAQAGPSAFPNLNILSDTFYPPTVFQPGLRSGMVQSAFVGLESSTGGNTSVAVNALASRSRDLLTTDFVNRDYSLPVTFSNPYGRLNPDLPPLSYRANQGFANYDGLTAVLRYHTTHWSGQIAYTWSHSIDNQSDPISGDYNLEFTSVSAGGSFYGRSAFAQQFNSGADRGNSDFDQRQSLVFLAIVTVPVPRLSRWAARLLDGWQVAGLGSVRSGLPFNIYAAQPVPPLSNLALIDNRASIIDPAHIYLRQPISGGVQILNPAAFEPAPDGQIGNVGRNAFTGPGTLFANLSVSRSFHLPRTPESARLVVRGDAYNFLNHANLYVNAENVPLGSPGFGTAQYGATGVQTTFPIQVPLAETPRQIQLELRLNF